MNKLKLLTIKKSTRPEKKLMAVFDNDGRSKTIHFGAKGMSDYTIHHDKERREKYLSRHKGMNEDWNKPDTAGALSKWILWGDSISLDKNIETFKKKFKL